MKALIAGSMAYDTIMVFHEQFKNHILPEKVHILNVSFLVPELRREYGGCAGNIAYNLKMLGGDPVVLATVGEDFTPYAQWLKICGIRETHIRTIPKTFTAQAFITTDQDDNQITAFHPGAMSEAHTQTLPEEEEIRLGIISPDGKDGMIQHAEELHSAGIPFIFDPGQGLPMFNGEELKRFLDLADWAVVNDYEAELLKAKTGLSLESICHKVKAFIVTLGAEGSQIVVGDKTLAIPAVKADAALDPTGCGDAYRAGLLYGLLEGLDWETTGRIASLLGSIKIESQGTQNHSFTLGSFKERFQHAFGYTF